MMNMIDRYDALTVREDKNGKAWFTKIGAAFANRNGNGYTIMLDAMPASADGQYKIMLREPQQRDGQQSQRGQQGRPQQSGYDPRDDDATF